MNIDEINLLDFRNYENGQIQFSQGMNIISGKNAQGKTNLIEAVSVISCGKSFRTRTDRELIRIGGEYAAVSARFNAACREQKASIEMKAGRRKRITLNGSRVTANELSGVLTSVLFVPEDLKMIKGGASGRRRLMDMAISQLRPGYAGILSDLNRNLEQKTRILRDRREKPSLMDMLDEFSIGLLKASAQIIRYRAAFVRRLEESAGEIHRNFSGGMEELKLSYKTTSAVTDPLAPAQSIFMQLSEHLRSHRQAELDSGQCLTGAHRDDMEFFINGLQARTYASQGQSRTAALSVKLAERDMHFAESGEYPVLLLDDVLSELDSVRREFVLDRITGGQTLISCCEEEYIEKPAGGRLIVVENGKITRME